ncbi:MAG: tetratricopeptide repeat protein [Deltaproteobacteria bacterium]|nr:tetratricopeptide repeat protein [Deltaproteobacteria bacterium]
MSLIREALKRSADETDPPSTLSSPIRPEKKKSGSSQIVKYGVLLFLLACLGGGLVFLFFPSNPAVKKIEVPSIPRQIVTKSETGPQEPVLIQEKVDSQPVTIGKVEDQRPQPSTLSKVQSEKGPAQRSEGFFKVAPPRFIIPKPMVRKKSSPAASRKSVPQIRPPGEDLEIPKAQAIPEETDPLRVVHLFNEAVLNQKKGLSNQALQTYQEILTLRPSHWETYNNLGLIYQDQKHYSKALEMFQKALALNPHYLKGYNNLGLFYLNLGKWAEAVNQFRKALDLDPNFLPAYINLATAYMRQGRVEQARKGLQKALEHDSESLEAHYNLGLLWEKEGVEDKALEHYQKFVSKAQGPYMDLANQLKKRWPELK